jgi:hypothetical protein
MRELFPISRMSALGQKQTLQHVRTMSALPPKADIGTQPRNVRFVPFPDILRSNEKTLFEHFIDTGEPPIRFRPRRNRQREPERPWAEDAPANRMRRRG